ncbi:MAG: ABC transporter ATP-binding protein [Devosia sp.]
MSGLRIEAVSKSFHSGEVVRNVSLEIPDGHLICILGPSGCGKTTLLRIIAGLEPPRSGRILFDGEDITEQPVHQRNFGMVFQSLALFPHLSAGENIAYGLSIRGIGKRDRRKRVDELLELVRLPGVFEREIGELSGGQRQRVAIARALAVQPRLLLLDEPLSALDANLRDAMQIELRDLQQRLGLSTICVTHDWREAMSIADLIIVMKEGAIEQIAAPAELYRRPKSAFVAQFIGSSNILSAVAGTEGLVTINGRPFRIETTRPPAPQGATISIAIRPEDVQLLPPDDTPENTLAASITLIRDLGATVEITLRSGDIELFSTAQRKSFTVGDRVSAHLPPNSCVVLVS